VEPYRHAAALKAGAVSSLPSRLFLEAYGGIWRLARPLLSRHKRLREDFGQRLLPAGWKFSPDAQGAETFSGRLPSPPGRVLPDARPLRLWIQAASGGEAWLLHALLPALRASLAAHPSLADHPLSLLCTTWTRQGLHILQKLPCAPDPSPGMRIVTRYFPLDHPSLMRQALNLARPDLIALLETELWPGLLAAAAGSGVPVLALNARMTEKSYRAYRKIAFFWREHAPERVLAVSPEDALRFARLFDRPERVEVMPNLKFDRMSDCLEALEEQENGGDSPGRAGEPALLAALASVREEEEQMLLPAVRDLHALSLGGHPVAVAVAPRHMHRVEAWKARLRAAGVPFRLRSEQAGIAVASWPDAAAPAVCLWDTFGELRALYAAADAVYVGASLLPLGGQNFLEAAAQGAVPLVGPHIDNFRWVGEEFFAEGLAVMLPAGADLRAALTDALQARLDALLRACRAQGAAGPDWRAARAGLAAEGRRRFAAWLRPRAGGRALAATAVTLALEQGLARERRAGGP
jgi:3-deoxy-D-manno-octulosonic-acid transferase